MSNPETTMGGAFAGWQPTGWTTILNAKDPSAPDRREALDRLVRT